MGAKVRGQLALDETMVEDGALEAALEARESAKGAAAVLRKQFDDAHEAAKVEIAKLGLEEGAAIRVGRFRIEKSATAARAVSFETKASSRIQISLADEAEAPPNLRALN